MAERTQEEINNRAKSDSGFRMWDKDGNLLVDYGQVTGTGKRIIEERKQDQ